MSEIYDNWERLVRVVLRREEDKQIAFWDSSSSSSTLSSFNDLSITSTNSQFGDHPLLVNQERRTQVPMDYSDLTLDHLQWKTMLPPLIPRVVWGSAYLVRRKRKVVWRSASLVRRTTCSSTSMVDAKWCRFLTLQQCFFLDPRTGKNCFLLGAAQLTLSKESEASEHFWGSDNHPKTRFEKVAKLQVKDPSFIYVRGSIETKMLSPKTLYAAYFVFGFSDEYEEHVSVDSSIRITYDESHKDSSQLHVRNNLEPSTGGRSDGWKEIELGDFFVGEGDNAAVMVELHDPVFNYSKSCLIMEGIEFRPLKGKRKT